MIARESSPRLPGSIAPADIARTGHDRVSIFLKPDHVDAWLSAQSHTRQELNLILGDPEPLAFEYKVAA